MSEKQGPGLGGRHVWRDGVQFEVVDAAALTRLLGESANNAAAGFANYWRSLSDRLDVVRLVKRVREENEESERRTDAFPLDAVLPFVIVHPDHAETWRLDPEVLARLRSFPRLRVVVDSEQRIQSSAYSLNHKQLLDFRAGVPVLMMAGGFEFRKALRQGGRNKDALETSLRAALAFEVFAREAEISALEYVKRHREEGAVEPRPMEEIARLAQLAWVEGAPLPQAAKSPRALVDKGHATANEGVIANAQTEFFARLWDEGYKIALSRASEDDKAYGVWKAAFEQIFVGADDLLEEDVEPMIKAIAEHVRLLLRAWLHATKGARIKNEASKRRRRLMQPDGRRTRPFDANLIDPMTKQERAALAASEFSAKELAEIALLADIDPNELCPTQVLAWPEFAVARQIGRLARGGDIHLYGDDAKTAREILFDPVTSAASMYADARALIRDFALSLRRVEDWREVVHSRTEGGAR
jgi:hypothetical protein